MDIGFLEAADDLACACGKSAGIVALGRNQDGGRATGKLDEFNAGANRLAAKPFGHTDQEILAGFARKPDHGARDLPLDGGAGADAFLDEFVDAGIAEQVRSRPVGPNDRLQIGARHGKGIPAGEALANVLVHGKIDEWMTFVLHTVLYPSPRQFVRSAVGPAESQLTPH